MYIGLPAPTNVRATVLSHCSVEVTWDELSDATEYIISYSTTASNIYDGTVTVNVVVLHVIPSLIWRETLPISSLYKLLLVIVERVLSVVKCH